MEKVRFGIIGIGNQGNYYASLLKAGKITNGELVAICDNKAEKLELAKQNYAGLEYYDDYKKMLESKNIDAILVETPHYAHPEIVMNSLKSGKHTLVDKPAGVYTNQVVEMNEFAKLFQNAGYQNTKIGG